MKGIDKKLDDAWAKAVKERDKECQYCRKTTYLNAHHIYSRSKRSVRWDLMNGITLCVAHHVFSSKFSAHKTGIEFADWLINKKGEKWMQTLRIKANTHSKLSKFEKEIMLKELKR